MVVVLRAQIQLNAANIFVPRVRTAQEAAASAAAREQLQLCLCRGTGRLFLARAAADCRAAPDLCQG